MKRILVLLGAIVCLAASTFGQVTSGNIGSNSSPVVNRSGTPTPGVNIAVCQPMPASFVVTGNLANMTLTIPGGGTAASVGFAPGMQIIVSGFTGADAFINSGTLANGVFTGGYQILSVAGPNITFSIQAANATSSSMGTVLQQGNNGTPCAGLSNVFSDPLLANVASQPIVSDQLGNWNVFAAPGIYYVQFYAPNVATTVKQIVVGVGNPNLLPLANSWTGPNNFFGQLLINSLPAIAGQGPFTIGDCVGVAQVTPFLIVNDLGVPGTPCPGTGGGGGSGTVVASPQFQLGVFPTSGSAATIQGGGIHTDATFKNLFIPGNTCMSGPTPWVDVTCDGYYARAATINTTATGSGTTLTVPVTSFQNNDWISIAGRGTANSLPTVTGLSATPSAAAGLTTYDGPTVAGMAGGSSYTYTVFPIDIFGAAGVPATPVTTATGQSAIGALPPSTISSLSLFNNAITVTTASPNNFIQNMLVHISGTSNNYLFEGWFPITSITNSSTFVLGNVLQYCNPACTGTGGKAQAWVGNVVAWTPNTQTNTNKSTWEYGICAQRPADGALHLVGISYPQTTYGSGQGFSVGKWNDFGSTFNNNVPWYLSDANCTAGAAQNEIYTGQVLSGGGTTTLGMSVALTVAATGQAARLDATPAFAAASAAATTPLGTIYVPPTGTNQFQLNTPLFIPFQGNMAQSGGIKANAPIIVTQQSAWYGYNSASGTVQFANTVGPVVTCVASPCVYVGNVGGSNQSVGSNQISGIAFEGSNNGVLLMLDSGGAEVQHNMFQTGNSGDYAGTCILMRPGGINYAFAHNTCVAGPSFVTDSSWAPAIYLDGLCGTGCSGSGHVGSTTLYDTRISRRGLYSVTNGGSSGALDVTFFYSQGSIIPVVTSQNTNGATLGHFKLDFIEPDTQNQADYAILCGVGCAAGAANISNISVQMPNGSPVSSDGGTIPAIITGGGHARPLVAIAALAAGSNEQSVPGSPHPSRGIYFSQNRLYPYGGILTSDPDLGVSDFQPNVPTPSLCLENSSFCLNVNPSTLSANRWQQAPDNSGFICITGLAECSYYADSGAANAYTITVAAPTGAPTFALVDGQKFRIKAAHANTTTSTLVINALTSHHIEKFSSGSLVDLSSNDIAANCEFEVTWDSGDSVYQLTSPCNSGAGAGSGTVNNSPAANNAAYYPGIGTAVSPLAVGALEQYAEGIDSGSANVYVIATTPAVTGPLADGMGFFFHPLNGNSGNSTVAFDSISTVPLQKLNGQSLILGDLLAGGTYDVKYNSTLSAWIVLNPSSLSGIIPIAQGGTGQSSANAAFNALAPGTSNCGLIVANGVNSYGNLGCGANGTTLTISGGAIGWTAPVTISGSGVNGQVSFWNGAATQTGSANFTFSAASGMSLQQGANNTTMLYGARFTDVAPTGFFEQYQNAAKTTNVWTIDASGNVVASGGASFGIGLVSHFLQIPEAVVAGCAAGFDTLSADSTTHRMQICNNNGVFANAVVAGVDINIVDQVVSTHLFGPSANAIPKVVAGNLVNSCFSDNGTNASCSEDLDLIGNAHTNEAANDVSTGTTNNLLAKFTSTGLIKAGTGDTAIQTYIVQRGGATSGNGQYVTAGQGLCTMDANASNTEGQYVIASTGTAAQCHSQAAAPGVGIWVIGTMVANSTTAGSAAKVNVDSYFYVATGAGTGSVTSLTGTGPIVATPGTITTTGAYSCPSCATASSPGLGLGHFAGGTQAMTSSPVVGADMTNNTVTATQLAAQYSKWEACNGPGLGDGLNAIPAATYVQFTCVNTTGVTVTLTGLSCWTDNAGSSTMSATNNAGTALLTGAVTCNSTKTNGGNAGTQSATTTLAAGDAITFTFIADGTSKQTNWTVKGTY